MLPTLTREVAGDGWSGIRAAFLFNSKFSIFVAAGASPVPWQDELPMVPSSNPKNLGFKTQEQDTSASHTVSVFGSMPLYILD